MVGIWFSWTVAYWSWFCDLCLWEIGLFWSMWPATVLVLPHFPGISLGRDCLLCLHMIYLSLHVPCAEIRSCIWWQAAGRWSLEISFLMVFLLENRICEPFNNIIVQIIWSIFPQVSSYVLVGPRKFCGKVPLRLLFCPSYFQNLPQ